MSQLNSNVKSNEQQAVNAQRGRIDDLAGIAVTLAPEELQGVGGGVDIVVMNCKSPKLLYDCKLNGDAVSCVCK